MTSSVSERADVAVWFELPVQDFDRAIRFYERVLGVTLRRETMPTARLAVFPYEKPAISGCLIDNPKMKPSRDGTTVYMNVDGRLSEVMARVVEAGGALASPRVELPPGMGAFVHAIDSEGNRVGFHDAS